MPVVVIENAKDAVPTAKALLSGGIDVMEITMRTGAALDSIRSVVSECPDMLVGAGHGPDARAVQGLRSGGCKLYRRPRL